VMQPFCVPAGISNSSSGTVAVAVSAFTSWRDRMSVAPAGTVRVVRVPFSPNAPVKEISLLLWRERVARGV
jgi:hypothetical protein